MGDTTIICLAKSRKPGGRCVAGRYWDRDGFVGAWIRPVSSVDGGAVAPYHTRCTDGHEAEVMDIVTVPLLAPCPNGHHHENQLLDYTRPWRRRGSATWAMLNNAVDTVEGRFWGDHGSSTYGVRDRVPESHVTQIGGSLRLIRLTGAHLIVQQESAMDHPPRRAVRADFDVGGARFMLKVTDPVVESEYFKHPDGTYELGPAFMCISMSEMLGGVSYRLVASIVTRERCQP